MVETSVIMATYKESIRAVMWNFILFNDASIRKGLNAFICFWGDVHGNC